MSVQLLQIACHPSSASIRTCRPSSASIRRGCHPEAPSRRRRISASTPAPPTYAFKPTKRSSFLVLQPLQNDCHPEAPSGRRRISTSTRPPTNSPQNIVTSQTAIPPPAPWLSPPL